MAMMSNLQIGLAIAGGLVLAAVVGHSAWSSRKNVPRQAQPDNAGDTRPEPIEPHLHVGADSSFSVEALAPSPPKMPLLDALVDGLTPIALEHPVSGEAVLAAMPPTRRVGSKLFAVEGLNVHTDQWEVPANAQRYSQLQAGIQLANRLGPLKDIEYSEYVVKTQAFADVFNGAAEFPEMRHELARAKELDQFASEHDAQLSFTLRAHAAAWSPGFITQTAARLGFVAGVMPGRMVLPTATEGLPPILVLEFDAQAALAEDPSLSAIHTLAVNLDVPQVARSERPFVRLRETCQQLAAAMDGLVTDDNGHALLPDALDNIGSELEKLYDALDSRELSAGSALARRLFS